MSTDETKPIHFNPLELGGWRLAQAATEYAVDAWQRGALYADVMRRRGNQYQEHLREAVPHVLDFPFEPVMSGRDLERPVNYWLVRILLSEDVTTDPRKRPFVVLDPRAGHGPGIGGFKADSEVGVALRAGHPCYFVGFLPDPVPGQTVEDVMRAEAAFLERVIALHPESEGKPVVIGNCQAGWQVLMTAAMRPELFGPIIVPGTPLSYWAGWRGKNPMRYAGGLLGGSWLTALTSDLGAGRFDGAWLVANFENLNPANTLWTKQYDLYAKVDTEAERYLGFEQYWGGYVFLSDVEMQWLVDNLFVGNRLATAELITSDGIRLDLRNIRSPIVVFCSMGDNITPPPQALGWIIDLYRDDADVKAHGQTIVYALHESVGHLGIFVSGSVGRKEHKEFGENIDYIDVLPPGIYHARLDAKTEHTLNPDLVVGDYVLAFEKSGAEEVRKIVAPDPESDRRFAAAARISEMNLGLYRTFLQPLVRAAVTPHWAESLQRLHPLRLSYELMSDASPLSGPIAKGADKVRENRAPASAANPFLQLQEMFSETVARSLDQWRMIRDDACEKTFEAIYGSPWIQALAGLNADDGAAPRPHPGVTPEHREYVAREVERLRASLAEGGAVEAGLRAIGFITRSRGEVDERGFNILRKFREVHCCRILPLSDYKQMVRQQALLMDLDEDAAVAAIPALLEQADPADIRDVAAIVEEAVAASAEQTPEERQRLEQMQALFEAAARSPKEARASSAGAVAGSDGRRKAPAAITKTAQRGRGTPR